MDSLAAGSRLMGEEGREEQGERQDWGGAIDDLEGSSFSPLRLEPARLVPRPCKDQVYVDHLTAVMDPVTRNDQKWLKEAALRKDRGRCVFSSWWHWGRGYNWVCSYPTVRSWELGRQNTLWGNALFIHYYGSVIFDCRVVWAVGFQMLTIRQQLRSFCCLPPSPPRIGWFLLNNLSNVLTLSLNVPKDLGELRIALLPLVCSILSHLVVSYNRLISTYI